MACAARTVMRVTHCFFGRPLDVWHVLVEPGSETANTTGTRAQHAAAGGSDGAVKSSTAHMPLPLLVLLQPVGQPHGAAQAGAHPSADVAPFAGHIHDAARDSFRGMRVHWLS